MLHLMHVRLNGWAGSADAMLLLCVVLFVPRLRVVTHTTLIRQGSESRHSELGQAFSFPSILNLWTSSEDLNKGKLDITSIHLICLYNEF